MSITYENGHQSAFIFGSEASAASAELRDANALIKNGKVSFTDEKFEKKIKSLLKHGRVGISAAKRAGQKMIGRYFLDINSPEHFFSTNGALVEGMGTDTVDEIHLDIITEGYREDFGLVPASNVLGNILDLQVDVPVKLFEEFLPAEGQETLVPVYSSKTGNKVIGDLDLETSEIAFTDEYIVERILASAELGIDKEIGISIHENEYYLDFGTPKYHLTKLMEVKAELDYEDDEGKFAHFMNDADFGYMADIWEAPLTEAELQELNEQRIEFEARYNNYLNEEFKKDTDKNNLKKLMSSISGKDMAQLNQALKKKPVAQVAVGKTSLGNSRSVETMNESTGNSMMSAYLNAALSIR